MGKVIKGRSWDLEGATMFIPTDVLLPLIDDNFHSYDSYASSLLPPYVKFRNITSVGDAVTSRGMFPEQTPELLSSEYSLMPYKAILNSSQKGQEMNWEFSSETVQNFMILKTFLHFEDSKTLEMTDKQIFEGVINSAMAYNFWCMLQMNQRRSIGKIEYSLGKPNFFGDFHEMNMQPFFPKYDKMKAYSMNEMDLLDNAPREQLESRLVKWLDDFNVAVRKGGNNRDILVKLGSIIMRYSEKLKWDPRDFFRHSRSKRHTHYLPLPESPKEEDLGDKVKFVKSGRNWVPYIPTSLYE